MPPLVALVEADPQLVELVGQVTRKLLRLTSATGAGLGIVDETLAEFRFAAGTVPGRARVNLAGTPLGACVLSHQTQLVEGEATAHLFGGVLGEVLSVLVIPVQPAEAVLGVLVLTSEKSARFSAEEVETAELLGEIVTGAFARAIESQMGDALLIERTRAIEGWGESSTTLESFFGAAPFQMSVVALEADDARYQAVNLAAANWLGLAAEEVVGQLASTCGPRTLVSPIVQACAQAATRAEPVRIEHAAPDAQSEMHHFVTTVARLPANRAAARPFCVITEDVTAAVQMRGQLQLADRLASLGTLAAGVAHEVNNPLSYVRSNLDFLIREVKAPSPSAEEIEGALKEAHDGVERVVRIVRDLKTLSHPNEHDTSVVDALEAVRTAVRMATAEVQRQARLRTTFEPLPLVRGGGNRLVQVILNLLVNAAQAIPPGSSSQEHEVRVHTTTDARGWAQIEVSDTGAGIPEAVQRKIFDPFFTTKPMGVGTGLGLSICHGIITQLGGALTFRSEVGHGTTFRVVLPPADVAP